MLLNTKKCLYHYNILCKHSFICNFYIFDIHNEIAFDKSLWVNKGKSTFVKKLQNDF